MSLNDALSSNAGLECDDFKSCRKDVEVLLNESPKRKDGFNIKVSLMLSIFSFMSKIMSKLVDFCVFLQDKVAKAT